MVVGFGVDLGVQLALTGTYDWKEGVAATVAGALTGGASAFIGTTVATTAGRAVANAVVGSGVSAVQAEALNVLAGQNNNVAGAALLGGAGGGVGSAIGDGLTSAFTASRQSAFDAASTADKLAALNMSQLNPNLSVGTASPALVAAGNAIGAAAGDAIGDLPSNLIPSANATTTSTPGK